MHSLAGQIAGGLAKAHGAGIVHRDLKPENVMVTSDGFVKILDFGLLMPLGTDVDSDVDTVTKATREGTVLGTAQYMSPEQAAGRRVDFRTDQFSLGSILYEMATGRRAFQKETTVETLAAIIRGEPEPLGKLNDEIPQRLSKVVERCLAKSPAERYESTGELASELKSIPETAPTWRARRRSLWSAVGLLAVSLAVTVGVNLDRLRDWLSSDATASPIESIAVLAFNNISGDPEQEYLADGMTEVLITDLAKIGTLR